VTRAISKAVCEVLAASLARWGIVDEILTDNGKVFTGRFGPQPVAVLFDRICWEERHLPSPHRGPLAHHHGQDRAVPPEPSPRVPGRPDVRIEAGRR
jgi:hypothetical protein